MKKRGKFNLSNTRLASFDMGELIPMGLIEVLPGDTIQMATSAFVRLQPQLAPLMHLVECKIHHWFVPHRLVWENFEDFITGGPTNSFAGAFPTSSVTVSSGQLLDYMGVPIGVTGLPISALPHRGYGLIWNEWYRDQDLQTERLVNRTDGNDATTNQTLAVVNWEKDYFTSSRPWEMKGPSISVPIGGLAPVTGIAIEDGLVSAAMDAGKSGRGVNASGDMAPGTSIWKALTQQIYLRAQSNNPASNTNRPQIFADLASATGLSINQLRQFMAQQKFAEARARYGSRYVEYLRYLGISSSDARLQRPEYLGGGSDVLQFSEVLQTAEGTNSVGTMRGHGVNAMRSNRFRRYFEEHGYIHTLMFIRPKAIYSQGLHRTFNRRTKDDFYQPEFETIGQQQILNKEVYALHAQPDGVFGYQDRYDEYRRGWSMVTGEFRTTLLNFWHMARDFSASPALNDTFIRCVPTERVFPVPSQDVCYVQARHNVQARRMLRQTGTPTGL